MTVIFYALDIYCNDKYVQVPASHVLGKQAGAMGAFSSPYNRFQIFFCFIELLC